MLHQGFGGVCTRLGVLGGLGKPGESLSGCLSGWHQVSLGKAPPRCSFSTSSKKGRAYRKTPNSNFWNILITISHRWAHNLARARMRALYPRERQHGAWRKWNAPDTEQFDVECLTSISGLMLTMDLGQPYCGVSFPLSGWCQERTFFKQQQIATEDKKTKTK